MGEAIKTRRGKAQEIDPLLFYDEGNENISVTGGWGVGYTDGNGTQTKESNHLYFAVNGTVENFRTYVTNNAINMTNINSISFEYEINLISGNGNYSYSGIAETRDEKWQAAFVRPQSQNQSLARGVYTLDVSGVSGNFYVKCTALYSSGTSGSLTMKVHRVWGEA